MKTQTHHTTRTVLIKIQLGKHQNR